MAEIERDSVTGVETTGHEWDGIRELNNPLPKWWLTVLYVTIVIGLGYTVFYPAWPSLHSYTRGLLGYNSHADYYKEAAVAAAAQKALTDRIAQMSVAQIAADPELLQFSLAGGKAAFNENCAACHGAGGQGQKNYPILADDNWLWGGKLEDIETTIRHGIRSPADPDTRVSDMPKFGADGLLKPDQIADVADFVLSLSKQPHDATAAARGEAIFSQNCAACHADHGQGNPQVGAPALNNQIWQFTGTRQSIIAQVTQPHQGVMPNWQGRLSNQTIKMLAVYVHSLSGGQ